MLLFVVGIAVLALLTLLVANLFGSVLAGWITIWASAVGLLLLLIDGLRHHGGNDDQHNAVPPAPRLEVTAPDDREPSVATELTEDEVELHPDIWPPEHPVHEAAGDDGRIDPRRAGEGESVHPDIWP